MIPTSHYVPIEGKYRYIMIVRDPERNEYTISAEFQVVKMEIQTDKTTCSS